MIRLQSVNVAFDGRAVLENISLQLQEQRIGVIGLNGSGKSTFVRLLNGLQLPDEGSVFVSDLDSRKDGRKIRRRVGFVFQNPDNQIVYPTVREDMSFGLKNLKFSKEEIEKRIEAALTEYGIEHLSDRLTHRLSGGEKQLIALVGVLIMQPEYIVLDEPTTLLDLKNKRRLMSVIRDLGQRVIMVTHDLDLLTEFDRVLCFHEGALVSDGAPAEVITEYLKLCAE
ncbi:MAG: ABC transporter ATP-binding protein [Sneathiella sp.]|nr:ABC transporter ATP-binding protein [Sneathiella sp.]